MLRNILVPPLRSGPLAIVFTGSGLSIKNVDFFPKRSRIGQNELQIRILNHFLHSIRKTCIVGFTCPLTYDTLNLIFMQCLFYLQTPAIIINCPPNFFFDGKGCQKCSGCPPGYGLKILCSTTRDTRCQRCLDARDYSDTTGSGECIK